MLKSLINYYGILYNFIFLNKKYDDIEYNNNEKIILYTAYCKYKYFNYKHYRNSTYGRDMYLNCSDLNIPHTTISLNYIFLNKFMLLFTILLYPIYGIFYSIYKYFKCSLTFNDIYYSVLFPNNWFINWRINCNITYLYYLNGGDYLELEDKWLFSKKCIHNNIPVSPLIKTNLFIKHKEIDGGQGCFKYNNVFNGGNWLIQENFENSSFLKNILPENAPLSTIRLVTINTNNTIKILVGVLRAGLKDSNTDHNSILFNIDIDSGCILFGKCINNWYKNRNNFKNLVFIKHPQHNKKITGTIIPDWNLIKKLVIDTHFKISSTVPIIGWDVALTNKGIFLLEANYSCSLFNAEFNKNLYLDFINERYKLI
jgi:hypothetical protein